MNEKELNKILNNWDMTDEEREIKKNVLKKWWSKLENQQEKEIIYDICLNINYYSVKRTVESLTYLESNTFHGDTNLKKRSLIFPIRKKARFESSNGIFADYIVGSSIRKDMAENLIFDNPKQYLKHFVETMNKDSEYLRIMRKTEELIDTKASFKKLIKENSFEELFDMDISYEEFMDTDITFKELVKEISSFEEMLEEINQNHEKYWEVKDFPWYTIDKLIFVDDFIGSGSSIEEFINEYLLPPLESLDDKLKIQIIFWILECSKIGENHYNKIISSSSIPSNITFELCYKEKAIDFLNDSKRFTKKTNEEVNEVLKRVNKTNKLKSGKYCVNTGLASFINAPNNNLPIITKESTEWEPLFPRVNMNRPNKKKLYQERMLEIRSRGR